MRLRRATGHETHGICIVARRVPLGRHNKDLRSRDPRTSAYPSHAARLARTSIISLGALSDCAATVALVRASIQSRSARNRPGGAGGLGPERTSRAEVAPKSSF